MLPYKSKLEMGDSSYVIHKIKENFNSFVSPIYEKLAISFLLKNYNLLKCGRWWSKDEEIDAVGIGEDYLIVAECKYSNKKVGIDVLENLQKKAKKIDNSLEIKKYILFSKSGFTRELQELKSDTISLIKL